MASKPVRWDSYAVCEKCKDVIYLCVELEGERRIRTEHKCQGNEDAGRDINACR